VVWVGATGRDAVISGYAQALRDLDLVQHRGGSAERAAGRFLGWLAETDQPWVVVLDDLADPAAMDGLWPAGAAGRVLVTAPRADVVTAPRADVVTAPRADVGMAPRADMAGGARADMIGGTRADMAGGARADMIGGTRADMAGGAWADVIRGTRADMAGGARVIGVGAFAPREALAYLSASLQMDHGQRSGALDLAGDLRFWPLALGLAGAFLGCTGLDCRDYRARFAERRVALAGAFTDDVSLATAASWSLSRELADQIPPRGMAGRALALISMLTPHGIPGAVLTSEAARGYLTGRHGGPADVAEVRTAVHNLARAGLVGVNDHSPARTVQVHEAVQAITRRHLSAGEWQQAAAAAADALAQAWSGHDVAPPVAQALRDCTARLHEVADGFLWAPHCHPALLQAGHSLDAEGLAGPAAGYWQAMLGRSQQALGADHPQTATIRGLLGSAYETAGRLDDAIAIYETALGEQEQGPGTRLQHLTRMYVAAGRQSEAIGLAERAVAGCERTLGPNHADTLAARADLAGVYLGAGLLDEAAAAFDQVLAGRERVLGPDHPDTTAARASLADVYRESGRFKEAIALGRRTLADRERGLGPDHPDTVAARVSLAAAYRGAKKPKDALRLYERILADRERAQGADHPDTILARSDLALGYLSTRKMAVAIAQYERALADSERVLGPDHPITEAVRQSLHEAAAYSWSVLGIDLRSAKGPR
jgi:tetratricopeptide (TPR) repeat protein